MKDKDVRAFRDSIQAGFNRAMRGAHPDHAPFGAGLPVFRMAWDTAKNLGMDDNEAMKVAAVQMYTYSCRLRDVAVELEGHANAIKRVL